MAYPIKDIEGIGPVYGEQLSAAGITNTRQLLEQCGGRSGRKRVAAQTGISEKRLLEWANLADLMRIDGIGPQYSELLEAAGVDTIKELRQRNAANLAAKMRETFESKRLTRAAPGEQRIAGWIAAAQSMTPTITH